MPDCVSTNLARNVAPNALWATRFLTRNDRIEKGFEPAYEAIGKAVLTS